MQIREIVDDEDKVCLSVLGFSWLDFLSLFFLYLNLMTYMYMRVCSVNVYWCTVQYTIMPPVSLSLYILYYSAFIYFHKGFIY